MDPSRGVPVRIASVDAGRLVIDVAAFGQILDKVGARPVAIVSINGPMRSGKSYLLNHFLRYSLSQGEGDWFNLGLATEFHWQSSSDRQTTGILVWSEPLVIRGGASGPEVAVLLLDTQGCFDDQTSMAENSLIFAFSCLVSSLLVYNFKNQLSEDVLQFLRTFVGYARAIGGDGPDSGSRLLFLVRDWQCPGDFAFGYYNDGQSPGLRNFKKEKLDPATPSMTPEACEARREIALSFGGLACCLMPYPGNELAQHDRAQNIDPMFVQAVRDLVPRILRGPILAPKMVAGRQVTGAELKNLVEKWAQLFAGAELPAAPSLAGATAEVHNSAAYGAARAFYEREMNVVHQRNGMSEQEFLDLHHAKSAEAVAIFGRSPRIRNDDVQRRYLEQLNADVGVICGSVQAVNLAKRQCREQQEAAEREAQRIREEEQRRIAEAQNQHHHNKAWYPRITKHHFKKFRF